VGVTVLNIEVDEVPASRGSATLSFAREGKGAERWRRIVDSLDETIELLERGRGFAAERPDGDTSLGRGARRVIPWRALPFVIAAWDGVPAVRAALADGQLRIEGELGSPLVLALARRWVADNLGDANGFNAELQACFE
jgi:hypothetical protein